MAKEIYLYTGVSAFSAELLMAQIHENQGEEIVLRVNTPGGSVLAGWGIIAKMQEHGNVTIKVDGTAMSMGAFMLPFANKVEALDVSKIMIHRADSATNTPEQKQFVDDINKDLRAKLEGKINEVKFKEITGKTLDDVFNTESRTEVFLSATEAKEIGLVDKITTLSTEEIKAMTELAFNVTATAEPTKKSINQTQKPIEMTIDQIKADHPAVYKSIKALGKTEGIAEHKELVSAWGAFSDVDAKAVTAGIETGVLPSMSEIITFMKKGAVAPGVKDLEADATDETTTSEPAEVVAENSELTDLEAAMDLELGIENKTV